MYNKKIIVFIAIFAINIGVLKAQELTILNKRTKAAIEYVYVYNSSHTHSQNSDANGHFMLNGFNKTDTLYFQINGYLPKSLIVSYFDTKKILYLEETNVLLNPISIVSDKEGEYLDDIPREIDIISIEQIRKNNPISMADALSFAPGVYIQKSQLGGGSPMIRGFAANSVLLVVDGVRMNNAIYRSGNLQNVISLDPNILQSAEILYGPGSVMYGSDAMGGVMNFNIRNPQFSLNDSMNFSGNAMIRGSSAASEQTVHVDLNFGLKKIAFLSSVSFSNVGDLQAGSRRSTSYDGFGYRPEYIQIVDGYDSIFSNNDSNMMVSSGYQQIHLMQKISYRVNKRLKFTYSFNYSTTSNIPRYDRLIQYKNDELKYAVWEYGPQKWLMNSLNMQYSVDSKLVDNLHLTIAHQYNEESRIDRKYQSEFLRTRTENVNVFSLNLDMDKHLNSKTELQYGFEGIYNNIQSTGITTNINTDEEFATSTRYPDGGSAYQMYGAYLSAKYEAKKNLNLKAGLRYNQIFSHSEFVDTTFYDFPYDEINLSFGALNGVLGMVYNMDKQWQIKSSLSSGFRAPNLDDIAKVFDSEPGVVVVPNSNLKPEYSVSIDFGVQKRFSDFMSIGVNAYYSYLFDAIVRREFTFNGQDSIMYDGSLSQVMAQVNIGKAYVYGFSADLKIDFLKYFNFSTTVCFTEGMDIEENLPLRHIPPVFMTNTLEFRYKIYSIAVFSEYNSWKRIDDFCPSELEKVGYMYTEEGSPSWATINARLSIDYKRFNVNFSINNILDQHYWVYSSGIAAPGRNFIVSLRFKL